jgi:RimJ/RimL family protein N-acetyltransferase
MPGNEKPTTQNMIVELRPWKESDLPLLARLMGEPAMTRYLGGPETPDQIRDRHEQYVHSHETGNGPMFVIEVGPAHEPAGAIGYWVRDSDGQRLSETGWSVLPEYQGLGIATRAAQLVAEQARRAGKSRSLHAFPSVDNAASNAVCRKAGFTLQGALDIEYPPRQTMRCNDWVLDLLGAGD